MTNKEFNIDIIEKYLSEKMPAEEREAFEKEMAESPELKEEVALHQDVLLGIEMHFEKELKKKLQFAEEEIKAEKQKPEGTIRPRWFIGIAASIAIVLLGIYFVYTQKPSSEKIFISYYQPYPNILSPSERSGDTPAATVSALHYYVEGNFEAAIAAFEANFQETINDPALRFYYGLSFLSLGDAPSAIDHLQALSTSEGHIFYHQSQWFLGLAFLKNNETDKAKEVFEKLRKSDTPYASRAEDVLKEIN